MLKSKSHDLSEHEALGIRAGAVGAILVLVSVVAVSGVRRFRHLKEEQNAAREKSKMNHPCGRNFVQSGPRTHTEEV